MTRTCPGLCGRQLDNPLFVCPSCSGRLPEPLRLTLAEALWQGVWTGSWGAHSRAMTDAIHYLADARGGTP